MHYPRILWALLSAGGGIWSRPAVWGHCRGRYSVCTKSCLHRSKGFKVEGFKMVQHILLLHHCCSLSQLKGNATSKIKIFHSSSHGVTIFRILPSARSHCRQNLCFNSPLRRTGRRNSRHRLVRFEKRVLDVADGVFVSIRGPHHLGPCSWFQKKRGDSLSTGCFRRWFHKKLDLWQTLAKMTSRAPPQKARMIHCYVIKHLVTQPSPPVQNVKPESRNVAKWNESKIMTPIDSVACFPNTSMNCQEGFAEFVQDGGRVRMGQVSWWWASPEVWICKKHLLDVWKLHMHVRSVSEAPLSPSQHFLVWNWGQLSSVKTAVSCCKVVHA